MARRVHLLFGFVFKIPTRQEAGVKSLQHLGWVMEHSLEQFD